MADYDNQRAQEMLRFLAGAGNLLAESLDYETTLASLLQLIVPRLADWCIVSIVGPQVRIRHAAVAHADPSQQVLARQVRRHFVPIARIRHGLLHVLRTGRAELFEDIDAAPAGPEGEPRDQLLALAPRSAMIVPLQARGQVLGAISLILSRSGRHYDAADLTLPEELARTAALALDNARLYEAEQRARFQAAEAADRTERLQAVTAALSLALTPSQVAEVIVREATGALGAQADAVRTGQPVLVESREELGRLYPEWPSSKTYRAWASVPLMLHGRPVGARCT